MHREQAGRGSQKHYEEQEASLRPDSISVLEHAVANYLGSKGEEALRGGCVDDALADFEATFLPLRSSSHKRQICQQHKVREVVRLANSGVKLMAGQGSRLYRFTRRLGLP